MSSLYNFEVETAEGKTVPLSQYRGKVLLIVNTASKRGFTPQFEGLEDLYRQFQDDGLVVLGFPSNQFANQDPGSNDEIAEFCQLNYGVSFPMHSKIDVNGRGAHPLFIFLCEQATGLLGSKRIKWNFTKFLINREGSVVARYSPQTKPASIAEDIAKIL